MELFLLYLFTRLNTIHVMLGTVIGICLIGIAITIFVSGLYAGDSSCGYEISTPLKEWNQRVLAAMSKYRKTLTIAIIPFMLVEVFLPSKEDAVILLGGWAVLEVAKTEPAKRLASKSVQLIEQTLDSYLKKAEKKE